jgi:hypothetical protein
VKQPVAVVDRVFESLLARCEDFEVAVRRAAVEHALFGRRGADRGLQQIFLIVSAVHAEAIQLVLFFVDELVVLSRLADRVAEQLVRPLGGVFGDVEDGPVVGRPGEAGHFHEAVFEQLAGLQIFDREIVFAKAGRVGDVGVQSPVVARTLRTNRNELFAFRQPVDVEQDFLGTGQAALLSAIDGVLLALFGAAVVPVPVVADRHAQVGLLDVREHLAVKLLFEWFQTFRESFAVHVLALDVLDNFRIGFFLDPVIRIVDGLAVEIEVIWPSGRDRRFGSALRGDKQLRDEEDGERGAKVHGDRPLAEEKRLVATRCGFKMLQMVEYTGRTGRSTVALPRLLAGRRPLMRSTLIPLSGARNRFSIL